MLADFSLHLDWKRHVSLAHVINETARATLALSRHMGLSQMVMAGAMGAVVGGMGVVAGSLVQVGRMPPLQQMGGAAAFMGTMFAVGTVVRQR